jgi:hypothetical protein
MANTVIALKKSGTTAATPSDLANGELAINYADGKLFYKAANGSILVITSGSTSNAFATVNASGTLILADSPTGILTIESGSGVSIVGDAVNEPITEGVRVAIEDSVYSMILEGEKKGLWKFKKEMQPFRI